VVGRAGFSTIFGLEEVGAVGAVFGVGAVFVLDVRSGTASLVVLVKFDRAAAVFAAKLGIFVDEGFGDILDLPEGLVAPALSDAAPLDFTLVDLFAEFFYLRRH
jgi:hypothetical protein